MRIKQIMRVAQTYRADLGRTDNQFLSKRGSIGRRDMVINDIKNVAEEQQTVGAASKSKNMLGISGVILIQ